jgi:hypothetical protein
VSYYIINNETKDINNIDFLKNKPFLKDALTKELEKLSINKKRITSILKDNRIEDYYIPAWWKAYNEIKHNNEGLKEYATLSNAIAATGAIFLCLHRIYGNGMISGPLTTPDRKGHFTSFYEHVQTSKLFINTDYYTNIRFDCMYSP